MATGIKYDGVRTPFGEGVENSGTVATGVTVAETGDAIMHKTTLTVDTTLGAIVGGTDLALGVLVYTLPAGAVIINSTQLNIALTAVDGNIDADTPDVGIGTTIGAGAVAVLGGTPAFENLLTGQTAANSLGTATLKTLGTQLVIEAAGDHTVYLNVADGWAASGEAACPITGTIIIDWTFKV